MTGYAITAGDLEPDLTVTVTDGAATFDQAVSWRMTIRLPDGTIVTDDTPTVVLGDTNASATVSHAWQAGETDQPGQVQVNVKALWPDAEPQTFPPRAPLKFTVASDLT